MTLQAVKDGVWCAIRAPKVTRLICIQDHKRVPICNTNFETMFLDTCSKRHNECLVFFSRTVQWFTTETNSDRKMRWRIVVLPFATSCHVRFSNFAHVKRTSFQQWSPNWRWFERNHSECNNLRFTSSNSTCYKQLFYMWRVSPSRQKPLPALSLTVILHNIIVTAVHRTKTRGSPTHGEFEQR